LPSHRLSHPQEAGQTTSLNPEQAGTRQPGHVPIEVAGNKPAKRENLARGRKCRMAEDELPCELRVLIDEPLERVEHRLVCLFRVRKRGNGHGVVACGLEKEQPLHRRSPGRSGREGVSNSGCRRVRRRPDTERRRECHGIGSLALYGSTQVFELGDRKRITAELADLPNPVLPVMPVSPSRGPSRTTGAGAERQRRSSTPRIQRR
jgi:hypothetical protein